MFTPTVKRIDSEDGESVAEYAVFPRRMKNHRIARLMAEAGVEIAERRCRHPYDCCAQWYGGPLIIVKKGNRALAYKRSHLNV